MEQENNGRTMSQNRSLKRLTVSASFASPTSPCRHAKVVAHESKHLFSVLAQILQSELRPVRGQAQYKEPIGCKFWAHAAGMRLDILAFAHTDASSRSILRVNASLILAKFACRAGLSRRYQQSMSGFQRADGTATTSACSYCRTPNFIPARGSRM